MGPPEIVLLLEERAWVGQCCPLVVAIKQQVLDSLGFLVATVCAVKFFMITMQILSLKVDKSVGSYKQ